MFSNIYSYIMDNANYTEFNSLEEANAYMNKWSNIVATHGRRLEYMKVYQKNNRDTINERLRKKYELNKDAINEKCRLRRKNRTPEQIEILNAKKKEYYKNVVAPRNKEKNNK